ncbi:hypothetical protein [Vreelandella subglaciescola]|jgi:hypothetical protein|uniref:hypothetical protein n=1 Tax=Vreelandella subglaciescola TaxID=29571 RepID=UPI0012AC2664|nr:hypothetical protein [Halomonas subglaciescola]
MMKLVKTFVKVGTTQAAKWPHYIRLREQTGRVILDKQAGRQINQRSGAYALVS